MPKYGRTDLEGNYKEWPLLRQEKSLEASSTVNSQKTKTILKYY